MPKTKSSKKTAKTNSNQMWGGRFDSAPADLMQEINQSISFDQKLYAQDIRASIAHAKMLADVGIISKAEAAKIVAGLSAIKKEIESGKFEFKTALEDIHMNIENRLAQIIGDTAGKLHTARSRNDQVAVDFRLWVRDKVDETQELLKILKAELIKKAEENSDVIMPGFTHLQIAQPVSFPHHLLAYFEMFKRDFSRLEDLRVRMNQCPLGAAALAGTSFPIDRFKTAKELGFDEPTANSIDSVSDRDFALEFLFALSLIMLHLSRFAEEMVTWMSKGFDFISFSDLYTSGSSIMPQKRNPDAAELIRAKTGRVFGSLVSLFTVVKSLALTYSKDLQEDKESVFDAAHSSVLSLKVAAALVKDMKINRDSMLAMAEAGYSTATELADWLVKNLQIPFRECHHITGKIVKLAENQGVALNQLKLAELQKIEPKISREVFKVLTAASAVAAKTSYGGTAAVQVKEQIKKAKSYLAKC